MSLLDLLLVPLARSPRSTSRTVRPLLAASRATPAPVAPAPTTSTSSSALVASATSALRWITENGRTMWSLRTPSPATSVHQGGAGEPLRACPGLELGRGPADRTTMDTPAQEDWHLVA